MANLLDSKSGHERSSRSVPAKKVITMFTTAHDEHGAFYVLWRGQVIYKRWPNGVSRVFYLPAQI
jgi:hypothetical protein